eukprot:scaffold1747_cov53-Attheya_sp.AAC.2
MREAFNGLNTFDDPLCWDVSSVTTMHQMFMFASAFNQDLSAWDVSSVTGMQQMFYNAFAFNQDISAWDVSSVTNMPWTFQGASAFNQNLCSWATKSPQLTWVHNTFESTSCNNPALPILNSGTPDDPHYGPFCFNC